MRKPLLLALSSMLLLTSIIFGVKALRTGDVNFPGWNDNGNFSAAMTGRDNSEPLNMIPGERLKMGFTMTVQNSGYDCWVFASLEASENFPDYLDYQIAEGWEELPGADGVYYRMVPGTESGSVFDIITDDSVTVRDDLTTEDLLTAANSGNPPYLNCHTYAIQSANFTPQKAWELLTG